MPSETGSHANGTQSLILVSAEKSLTMLPKEEGLSSSSLNTTLLKNKHTYTQKKTPIWERDLSRLRKYRCGNQDEIMEQSDQNHLSSALPKISKACFIDINSRGQGKGSRSGGRIGPTPGSWGSWPTTVPLAPGSSRMACEETDPQQGWKWYPHGTGLLCCVYVLTFAFS